jgi:enoyl-CoA hydratase
MIIFEKTGHVAKVGLNNPKTKNALCPETLRELYRVWEECQRDDAIRVVVLFSALPEVFCSGMDLKKSIPVMTGMRKSETDSEKWLVENWQDVGKAMLRSRTLDRPVIAAINGYCITGGFEMSMACELRVASEDAVFQMREVKLGLMPMSGSSVFLPGLVGNARAMEILLTGDCFSAAQLYEWGFLNRVTSREKLMDEALALAETIAANGPRAVRGLVRCSRLIRDKSVEDALKIEEQIGAPIFTSDDAKEGVSAQLEKRKPVFK